MKKPSFFWKKNPKFERFEISCKFNRILQQTCNLQQFVKISRFFFEIPIYLLFKKPKFSTLNVLKMHAIPVAFYVKIATFSDFKKNRDFSWNTHLFFIKIRKISTLNTLRILALPFAFSGTLLALAIFQNVKKKIFKKTIYLFKKSPKFRTFWESYQFSRSLWQIFYL